MKVWIRIHNSSDIVASMDGCRIRYKMYNDGDEGSYGYGKSKNPRNNERYIKYVSSGKFHIMSNDTVCIKTFNAGGWDICQVEIEKVKKPKPKKIKDNRSEFEIAVCNIILG